MKILFTVEFYEPHKGGAEEVVRQLAERLAKRGHEVTVATSFIAARSQELINGVKVESFKIGGNEVSGIKGDSREIMRYQKFLQKDFDVVINYAAQIWTTDLAFPCLSKITAKKIIVPCGYSNLTNPHYKDYFVRLPLYLKEYQAIIHLSANYQDKRFDEANGFADKSVIIPNGAASEEFSGALELDIRDHLGINQRFILMTLASHYRDKGHGFVIEAFQKLGRGDCALLIIGENPGTSLLKKARHFLTGCQKMCWLKSKINSNIYSVRGNDRRLVIASYQQSDMFLFGSKKECAPLVLYEAFAAGLPFIGTPVGNLPDYGDLIKLVSTPGEMADAIKVLLEDAEMRARVSAQEKRLWQEKYTWERIVSQYEELIEKL